MATYSNLVNYDIEELSNLLQEKLSVEAVGGHKIPYKGVVNLLVQLKDSDLTFKVPFLVTKDEIEQPILGFNVLETFVNEGATLKGCMVGITVDKINSIVNLLKFVSSDSTLCNVSILKQGVKIRSGEVKRVPVKIRVEGMSERRTPVLFEPVLEHAYSDVVTVCSNIIFVKRGASSRTHVTIINRSNKEVTLPGRMVIGSLSLVKNVTSVEGKQQEQCWRDLGKCFC